MKRIREKSLRIASACVCLVAVALLYAPLGAAALLAHGIGCCASGYCPIKEHHHKPVPNKQAESQESTPMDCGHDMGGLSACSMSCCQDTGRAAVMPVAFVLPQPTIAPATREVIRPVQITHSIEISRFSTPLPPPPRFVLLVP